MYDCGIKLNSPGKRFVSWGMKNIVYLGSIQSWSGTETIIERRVRKEKGPGIERARAFFVNIIFQLTLIEVLLECMGRPGYAFDFPWIALIAEFLPIHAAVAAVAFQTV